MSRPMVPSRDNWAVLSGVSLKKSDPRETGITSRGCESWHLINRKALKNLKQMNYVIMESKMNYREKRREMED